MSNELVMQLIDAATGESIIRPYTADEIKAHKAMQAEEAKSQAEAQAKADAKASALAKLAALGLTEEEIAEL
jgi:hypothetical protein